MKIDIAFTGSVPDMYEQYLVPLIFESYAEDLASRLGRLAGVKSVLEIAAGTGVVTREMARTLPATTRIVATDLNQAMLDRAQSTGIARRIEWKQADVMALPFRDASFDAAVCQFGVMFFPDRPNAFREIKRVLRPGGTLLFNLWDSLDHNDFARIITGELARRLPENPPRFLARTPYAYFDHDTIRADLEAGGFADAAIEVVTRRSRARSALEPAMGFVQGCPLRSEVEELVGPSLAALIEVTGACTAAIEQEFGDGRVDGKIQALVVEARVR